MYYCIMSIETKTIKFKIIHIMRLEMYKTSTTLCQYNYYSVMLQSYKVCKLHHVVHNTTICEVRCSNTVLLCIQHALFALQSCPLLYAATYLKWRLVEVAKDKMSP